MKLLYLMTEPFGVGGVQSDILALTEDLTKKGHEVFVATNTGILQEDLQSKGARFIELNFHFNGPAGLWKSSMALRKLIKQEKIEMLAPQSVRTTIASYFSLRLIPFSYRIPSTGRPVPIVTTIHNIHSPVHFKYGGHILNRCSDYVMFESHYERDRMLASGLNGKKSGVIHSGIDTGRFQLKEPQTDLLKQYGLQKGVHKIFGIVARLHEQKGHKYLLEAFAKVHAEDKDARLLIIGDGPLLDETKARSSSLALDGVAIFTGLQRNIPDFLSVLDVFVLSSVQESFPLAAREAMAAGKAVIAPRIGGCPEVVEENKTGILFEPANVGELANAMRRITQNELFLEYGKAARKRVEQLFSRRRWTEENENIYLRYEVKSSK